MSNHALPVNGKAPPWIGAILKQGFTRHNGGFRLDDLILRRNDRWFTLESESDSELSRTKAWYDQLGQRGLWRWIPAGQGWLQVFEFPAPAPGEDREEDWTAEAEDQGGLAAHLAWAITSRRGGLPAAWKAPARKLVASWLPDCLLTVRCGSIVRRGELILTPDRWAMRFAVLPVLSPVLRPERREWLQETLAGTLQQWRMVRLGFSSDEEHTAVVAEVDFSGAPHSETLFSAGLYGLRHVVGSLAETLEVLADPNVVSEILAVPPSQTITPKRKQAV